MSAEHNSCRQAAFVLGATSQIGEFLIARLLNLGWEVHAVSRRRAPDGSGAHWHLADISESLPAFDGVQCRVAFHLAPLWLLPALVPQLASRGVTRIVAFGSTSMYTKRGSHDSRERLMAVRLAHAEEDLAAAARVHGIAWTILRPTLVYDCRTDRNITAISRFIRRWRFFPVIGAGCGRRQPVHAEDLANAAVSAAGSVATHNRMYNLSGGSTVTYREMVEEIFRGLGRRPRILTVGPRHFGLMLKLAKLSRHYRHLTPAMLERVNHDLCFDHSNAARDFGYSPRPFRFELPEREQAGKEALAAQGL